MQKIANLSKIVFSLIYLLVTLPAYSNDSIVTVAAGGIEYKKSDKISMDQEDLQISINKISITYHFFNHSNKEVEETIAFPLPLAPVLLGGEPYEMTDCNKKNRFKLTINGQEFIPECQIKALDNTGKDITNILKQNHITMAVENLVGYMDEGELERNLILKKQLDNLHLLDKNGLPIWKTQTTFYWKYKFKPNSTTVITHQYIPYAGHNWLISATGNPPNNINEVNLNISNTDADLNMLPYFCPSNEAKHDIIEAFKGETTALPVSEVEYILTTGANWKNSIKKFNLEIIPPSPTSQILFCWDGKINKLPNGTIQSSIDQFIPKKDLDILFIE